VVSPCVTSTVKPKPYRRMHRGPPSAHSPSPAGEAGRGVLAFFYQCVFSSVSRRYVHEDLGNSYPMIMPRSRTNSTLGEPAEPLCSNHDRRYKPTDERMHERTNARASRRTNCIISTNDRKIERTNGRTNERTNARTNERSNVRIIRTNERTDAQMA
jgi:hypothetical protein